MQICRFTLAITFSREGREPRPRRQLSFLHYNYCRSHQTLAKDANGVKTPAMAAGLAELLRTIGDFVFIMGSRNVLQ